MKEFNIHFYILFFIAIVVSFSEYIIYFFNTSFLLTNLIVGIILLSVTLLLYKRKKISFKSDFSKYDLIMVSIIIIYIVIKIPFPDLLWDTRSYHIYLQENVFSDKINNDFFAARNLNSFLFALGDRVFYLFRIIFGYRFGTLISYYLMIILYYQVKRILLKLDESKNENKKYNKSKDKIICVLSIIPTLSSIVFAYSGSYYIDNFGLIFLLEIAYIVFFEKDILKNRIKLYILGIIIGLSIAIKVTNIILIIPFLVYLIISNYKEIKNLKIYDYAIEILCVLLPFFVYVIYNYVTTKNPVFPYYNNIFNSEYFMSKSWKDTNFGARNVLQFIFWPLYIVFNPKRAFDTRFVDITWGLGYITVIGYIIYCIINKKVKNNKVFYLAIILFISYYIWQIFLIGYVRYATIILILSMIVVINVISQLYMNNNKRYIFLLTVLVVISIPSIVYDFGVVFKDYNSVSNYLHEYKINISRVIKDRKAQKVDVQGILGAIGDDSLLPTMLNKDNKIFNLEEWVTITNEKTKEMYNEKINNKEIYVLVDEKTIDIKKEYLRNNNFEILEEEKLDGNYTFLSPSDMLYLFKVIKRVEN